MEVSDELATRLILYGPQLRSGLVIPINVYRADPRAWNAVFHDWQEAMVREYWLWMDWGSVTWFPEGQSISRQYNSAHEAIYAGMILESLSLARHLKEQT